MFGNEVWAIFVPTPYTASPERDVNTEVIRQSAPKRVRITLEVRTKSTRPKALFSRMETELPTALELDGKDSMWKRTTTLSKAGYLDRARDTDGV
jgi:hypothetical protein